MGSSPSCWCRYHDISFGSFEAEPPASRSDGLPTPGRKHERVGRRGSRHFTNQATLLHLADSSAVMFFTLPTEPIPSDTVAQAAGITGRSNPACKWWGHRPRRSFSTGEERPSSPATIDGEPHIKAPPSTSEPGRVSEVGWGRLREFLVDAFSNFDMFVGQYLQERLEVIGSGRFEKRRY